LPSDESASRRRLSRLQRETLRVIPIHLHFPHPGPGCWLVFAMIRQLLQRNVTNRSIGSFHEYSLILL
jgi:hypothetical protein